MTTAGSGSAQAVQYSKVCNARNKNLLSGPNSCLQF